ncbi:MAG: shikimate kinase [Bacteroidaceae bacterium]
MIRIFLIGYMGAGKTTLGQPLARALGVDFIDLDWYIEGRFHCSIPQLFAERGEAGFRQVEQRMLHEVGEMENVVVSTGGGTPCFGDNVDYMRRMGQTVFLQASEEALFRRLRVARHKRPLLRDKDDDELLAFIRTSLEARLRFYSQAEYTLPSDELESRSQIARTVERTIRLLGLPFPPSPLCQNQ